MDLFAGRKLLFDRTNRKVEAMPSAASTAGFVTIAGRTMVDTFMVIPVKMNGMAMQAIIDTGAARTIVNPAVIKAMGWTDSDDLLRQGGEIRGATTASTAVTIAKVDVLAVGPINFRGIELLVSANGVAEAIGLNNRLVIILGSALLNAMEAYAIDYPRGELQSRMPIQKS